MKKTGFNKELKIKYKFSKGWSGVSKIVSAVYSPSEAMLLALMIEKFNYWADRGDIVDFGEAGYGFTLIQKDVMKVLNCSPSTVVRLSKSFVERGWITKVRDDNNQFNYIILNVEKIMGLEIDLQDAYRAKMKEYDDTMPTIEDKRKAIKKHKEAKAKVLKPKNSKPFTDYKQAQEKQDKEAFALVTKVVAEVKEDVEEALKLIDRTSEDIADPNAGMTQERIDAMSDTELKERGLMGMQSKRRKVKRLSATEQKHMDAMVAIADLSRDDDCTLPF